jgi:DNA repair exonuclease SbcCD ATPase subunit
MLRSLRFGFAVAALFFFWSPASAQERATQAVVLQKLNEMDLRFAKIETEFKRLDERFNTVEVKIDAINRRIDDKIEAVNQRIDDKFNLIIGLLGLIAAFLALPYIPKILERYKMRAERKEDIQRLQEQIDQIKSQLAQLIGPAR